MNLFALPRHTQRILRGVLLGMMVCGAVQVHAGSPVTVRLQPSVRTDRELIVLADIAQVSGGDPNLRRKIEQLDIAELAAPPASESISRAQVLARLGLAGLSPSEYRLAGSATTDVERIHGTLSDDELLSDLRAHLTSHWQLESDSTLEIRLHEPLSAALRRAQVTEIPADITVAPLLELDDLPGKMHLLVGIYKDEKLIHTFHLSVDVQIFRPVTVAVRSIGTKRVITSDDVRVERRRLTGRMALEPRSEAIGSMATRGIRGGQIISASDLKAADVTLAAAEAILPAEEERPDAETQRPAPVVGVKVQRRTRVKMVARKPGLVVTLHDAELMRDAMVGDYVEVRNSKSKVIVSGRLVSPSVVEVN